MQVNVKNKFAKAMIFFSILLTLLLSVTILYEYKLFNHLLEQQSKQRLFIAKSLFPAKTQELSHTAFMLSSSMLVKQTITKKNHEFLLHLTQSIMKNTDILVIAIYNAQGNPILYKSKISALYSKSKRLYRNIFKNSRRDCFKYTYPASA